jgi:hypothetical protein
MLLHRFQIVSTGEFFDLGLDSVVPLELNTTIFNDQADMLGGKTYSFTAPLNNHNKAILRNAHLILTSPKLRKFKVRWWIGQNPWVIVDFVCTVENGTLTCNLYIGLSVYANQLKNLTINLLSDPLIDDQLHFDTVAEYKAYINSTVTAAPGIMPMVFIPHKNTAAYKTIDPANYGDYPDLALPMSQYINRWVVAGDGTGSFAVDVDAPFKETQSPAFYLWYILQRIARYLGLTPVGSVLTEEAFQRLAIQSMVPISQPAFIIADYWAYMNNMSRADFLKGMRTDAGIFIDINPEDKLMLIESLVNLQTKGEVIDLREYQLTGMRETGTQADAYTIGQDADGNDTAYSDTDKSNMPVLTIGDLNTAIQITDVKMATVATKMITEASPAFPHPSSWRIPMMQQPIYNAPPFEQISSVAYADRLNFKLRLWIFWGMKPDDSLVYTYPYGSIDNFDKDGLAIGSYSLALNATSAVFLAIRHRYNLMVNSKPFEMDFELTHLLMMSIKANNRILVKDDNKAPVYCFLDKLATDIADKEKLQVKLTLWPDIMIDNTAEILPGSDGGDILPPPVDNGAVWVRMELRNIIDFDVMFPTPSFGQRGDLYVTFWADAAATIPKDVTDLPLRYSVTISTDDVPGVPTAISYPSTEIGGEILIAANQPISVTTGGHHYGYAYDALVSAYYTVLATIIIT